MTYWALQHPMMTFWLGLFAILVVDNIVANICGVITAINLTVEEQRKSKGTIRMHYKGYHASVEYDEADEVWCGTIMDIEDSVSFYGETLDEAWTTFHNSVDNYLEVLKQYNKN